MLWKYGVIASNNIPFLIDKLSEFQCQYGSPRRIVQLKSSYNIHVHECCY